MDKQAINTDRLTELFLESHFKDALTVVADEEAFAASCEALPCEQEYYKLKRFFMTVSRHLRDIDEAAFSKTFAKLYQDAFALSDFSTKLAMQNTLVSQIYERSFLKALEVYNIEPSRELEDKFSKLFVNKRNDVSKKVAAAVNTKFFILDKLLWFEASKSEKIKNFFEASSIDGYYDSATFIKYYLKNTDAGQTQKEDRIQYLKDILKIVR